jgi:putative transposase
MIEKNSNLKSNTNFSENEIQRYLDQEKNEKVRGRLNYLLTRSKGYTVSESAKLNNVKKSLAYYIERVWYFEGYEGLIPKKGGGRKTKLNDEQMNELNRLLSLKNEWTINEVLDLIKNKFDLNYSYEGVKKLLSVHFKDVIIVNYFDKKAKEQSVVNRVKESELHDPNINEIIELISDEKDAEVLKRIFYVLLKNLGISNQVISTILGISMSTGNNWIKRWEKDAYEGLLHKPGQGRKPNLSDEDIITLKKNLDK